MKQPSKNQKIEKLARMCEVSTKYAQDKGLQIFIFHESKDHTVALSGSYSPEMLINLAAHLGMHHPNEVRQARMLMIEAMGVERVKAEEAKDNLVLGLDGKPIEPTQA